MEKNAPFMITQARPEDAAALLDTLTMVHMKVLRLVSKLDSHL